MKRKPDFKNGIFHGKPIYVLAVILLTVLLVISILTAVTIGSVDLSVKDVYSVILYKVFGIGDPEVYGVGAIVRYCMVYPPSPYSSCNRRWHGSGSCRCGNAGHCEKSDCRSVYSGYFLWCISWCNSGNLSWSWSRIWLQLYWNLRIYRSLPYFCTGTDHCKI